MLTPFSWIVSDTVFEMLPAWRFNSCRYLVRKYIVPSEAIPNAMLKIKIVDGFSEIFAKPIMPAVISKGTSDGISAIKIIRPERKRKNIRLPINKMASMILSLRLTWR